MAHGNSSIVSSYVLYFERSEVAEICLEWDMCLTVGPTPDHSRPLLQYMFTPILYMSFVTLAVYVKMYLPVWLSLTAVLQSPSILGAVPSPLLQPTSMAQCRHKATMVDHWKGKKNIIMLIFVCVHTLWYVGWDRCVGDKGNGGHPWEQSPRQLQPH